MALALLIVHVLTPRVGSSHPSGYNSVGRNPAGSYPALNWLDDGTQFEDSINVAKLKWNNLDRVVISNTVLTSKVDIYISDYYNDQINTIGSYYHDGSLVAGRIRFNEAKMSWSGGTYPGLNAYRGATRESARNSTAVHEFGHAIGLAHHCKIADGCTSVDSVMVDGIRTDETQGYNPSSADVSDFYIVWP